MVRGGAGKSADTKTDDDTKEASAFSAGAVRRELGLRGGDAEGLATLAAVSEVGNDEAALRARLGEIQRQKAAIVKRQGGGK